MDQIIPWSELTQALKPYYPDPTGPGRRPKGLERMLRIYFMQHWFNLSDPGMEEALYDLRVMRDFAGIDLGEEAAPDETTILNFRHLLEEKNMGAELLRLVNTYLDENGLRVSRRTIVDASIINAPSSTKNRDQARDPDMHQTKKGNQWYFGMKLHIGVDSKTKLVHNAVATAANVHDSQVLVWCNLAYAGQQSVLKEAAPGQGQPAPGSECAGAESELDQVESPVPGITLVTFLFAPLHTDIYTCPQSDRLMLVAADYTMHLPLRRKPDALKPCNSYSQLQP
jgi:IS5 family transposase